jgi:hypothetical protein
MAPPVTSRQIAVVVGTFGAGALLLILLRRRRSHFAVLQVLRAIDEVHARDPAADPLTGEPQELAYAKGMTKWLRRLVPDPSPALQVACRAQHLERWLYPRDTYPRTKEGYFQWRTNAKLAHGRRAAALLQDAGLGHLADRVAYIISKKGIGCDPESQAMEDAACLVFLEEGASKFIRQEADKGVDFIVNIFRKTWGKMSPEAHALALQLNLPADVGAIVAKALADDPPAPSVSGDP